MNQDNSQQDNNQPSKLKQYQNSEKVDNAFDAIDSLGSALFFLLIALLAFPIFIGAVALFTLGKIWLGLAALAVLALLVVVVVAIKWGSDWLFDRAGSSLDQDLLNKPNKQA